MSEKGILFIISGPSGAGKGTVVEELLKNGGYALSISATTRKPRPYEQEGKHYFFKEKEEFENMIENGMLLEHACFCGNFYGTPKEYVERQLESGVNIILEIEVQGALQVKKIYPESVLVFLVPPSLDELRRRLENRGTESHDIVDGRVARAREELKYIKEYDYIVINDFVDCAVSKIMSIAAAEKLKVFRNQEQAGIIGGEI